jgi:hypothetical protein
VQGLKRNIRRIRLSLDGENGELTTLLNDLQMWNASLKHCFERLEVPWTESVHDRAVLALHNLFKPERCDKAIEDVQILHETLSASWNCTCALLHEGRLRMNWHAKKMFPPPRLEMALSCEKKNVGTPLVAWKTIEMTVSLKKDQQISSSQPVQGPLASTARKPANAAKSGIRVRFRELNPFKTSKIPNSSARQDPSE